MKKIKQAVEADLGHEISENVFCIAATISKRKLPKDHDEEDLIYTIADTAKGLLFAEAIHRAAEVMGC